MSERKLPSDEIFIELFKTHTYKEIASICGISISTVYNRARRFGLSHPNRKDNRLGEIRMMNCGMECTIIAYRSALDIDVQFEDGAIITNRQYELFRKGSIRNPNTKRTYKKRNLSKEELIELLKTNSIQEIAEMYKVCKKTVCSWYNKAKINRRELFSPDNALFQKYTDLEIAEMYCFDRRFVWRYHKRHNIPSISPDFPVLVVSLQL